MFCLTISKILELFSRFPYVLALGDCEKKHYLHLEHRWGGIDISMHISLMYCKICIHTFEIFAPEWPLTLRDFQPFLAFLLYSTTVSEQ